LNPAINTSCRVEVLIKTTSPPKRGGLVSRKMLQTSI
jgi:hypothetical protein